MALMSNPNLLSVTDVVDGIGTDSGCGCGCAGCGEQVNMTNMEGVVGAGLGNIAQLGGLGEWDQYDPLGTGVPYPTQAQTANPSYSWSDVFKQGASTGFGIVRDIFGGPRPGTYITNGPNGSSFQRLPQGGSNVGFNLGLSPPGLGASGGNLMTYVVLGVVGFIAVKAISGASK